MDKKSLKKEIRNYIDKCYQEHNLPKETISEDNWNIFYDVIEIHFKEHHIEDQYETAINYLVRRALYFAALDKTTFSVEHLIKVLKDLIAYNIYSDEIEEMKYEILDKISKNVEVKLDELKEKRLQDIITNAIKDGVENEGNPSLKFENPISLNDWFTAFDVIETHYKANGKMNFYYVELYYYVRAVITKAIYKKDSSDYIDLLSSPFAVSHCYSIWDDDELEAISKEINEKIKGKSYKK